MAREERDEGAARLVEAGVVDTDPKGERVPQRRVLDRGEHRLELTHRHVEELALLLVRRAVGDQVERLQGGSRRVREGAKRAGGRSIGSSAVSRVWRRLETKTRVGWSGEWTVMAR